MQIDGYSLTLDSLSKIAIGYEKVTLSSDAVTRMKKSRAHVEKAAKSGEKIYSINTGFGYLSKVTIPNDQLARLQTNLIRSHCSGIGQPLSEAETRAMVLLRANVLAKGFSGVRVEIAQLLVDFLNQKIHPVIPSKGSVGASGDLAPLAHLAAVLIGEGEAIYEGNRLPGAEALKKAGLKPIALETKEGLALINGTQQMTAIGALTLLAGEELTDLADLICCMSLEGVLGTPKAFTDWIHTVRPYPGQELSAKRMRKFMEGSEISQSHSGCDRVQDPYSFRCAPQVHGAVRECLRAVRETLSIEINSATDNPLVNPDTGELLSGGNFHGQPVAFALDYLAIGLCELASLSERRTAKLIDPSFSDLPAFLVKNEGLNSGFMIPHVVAASLVSENKVLAHPGSVDSIPTSNEKEDHVSMGPLCARKAKQILENSQQVLAIEAFAAAQAIDFRKPLKPGKGPLALHTFLRKQIETLVEDRVMSPDMEKIAKLIQSGELHAQMKKAAIL